MMWLAHKLWIERFPDRMIPCAQTFRLVVPSTLKLGPKECSNLNNKFWNASKKNPTSVGTSRLAAEVGVSQFLVHRTLKEQGLHPYHVQKVQALEPADFPRRIIYYAMS